MSANFAPIVLALAGAVHNRMAGPKPFGNGADGGLRRPAAAQCDRLFVVAARALARQRQRRTLRGGRELRYQGHGIGACFTGQALAFAFVSTMVSDVIFVAVAVIWFVPDRRFEPLISANREK